MPRNASIKYKSKIIFLRVTILSVLLAIVAYFVYKLYVSADYGSSAVESSFQHQHVKNGGLAVHNPQINFVSARGDNIIVKGEYLEGNDVLYDIKKLSINYVSHSQKKNTSDASVITGTADFGNIDTKQQIAILNDNIEILYNDKYSVTAKHGQLEYYTGNGVLKQNVSLRGDGIQLVADEVKIYNFGERIFFEGDVKIVLSK